MLMLYPAFGKTDKKPRNETVYEGLGSTEAERQRKMTVYHKILANNSKKTRDEFFTDPLVQRIWDKVMLSYFTEELTLEGKPVNEQSARSYKEVTRIMRLKYQLPMPKWWAMRFPEPEKPSRRKY